MAKTKVMGRKPNTLKYICREIAPDGFVDQRHGEKKEGPAPGQLAPAFVVHFHHGTHDGFDIIPLQGKAGKDGHGKTGIDDCGFELDEGLVLQPQRQNRAGQYVRKATTEPKQQNRQEALVF